LYEIGLFTIGFTIIAISITGNPIHCTGMLYLYQNLTGDLSSRDWEQNGRSTMLEISLVPLGPVGAIAKRMIPPVPAYPSVAIEAAIFWSIDTLMIFVIPHNKSSISWPPTYFIINTLIEW
jgi:hypothetical protein